MKSHSQKEIDETLIVDEAVRFFYDNLNEVSWLQTIFPVVIAWIFIDIVDRTHLLIWLILTLSVYLGRIVLTRRYKISAPRPDQAPRWGWYLTSTTFFSGILWGYAILNFHDPDQIYHNVLIYLVVIGFAAGSLMLTTYWLSAFYAYVIPALGSAILDQLMYSATYGYTVAFLLFIFLIMLFRVAHGSNKIAYDAIRIAYKNNELIEKLEQEKEKAEAASHAKTRFLASANHDLRQPVHALSLLVHGLKKELNSAQGKLLFLRLERSVSNLGELLESLLDLSRLDASAVKVTPTKFSIASVSSQMLTEFLPIAREKGLRFSVRPSDELLYTDKTLLIRLLRNLLNNAFRYTHHGGVQLGYRKRGDGIVFEVWDSGIGIAKHEKDNIFSEFYQSENTERDRSKGLGLGLSICQRIATLLDTELSYRSREGKGSVFRFKLPVVHGELPDIESDQEEATFTDLAGKILLVVDDDIEVLQAMIQLLKNWDMIPVTARNSSEAFEILEEQHLTPDALICDHRLSDDETGLGVIRQILHRFDIPALMITGDTAPENILTLERSGFPVLHKPVSPDVLYKALTGLLSD